VVSIQDVYAMDPAPPTLPADQRAHIFGVQANLWSEHMPTEHDVELMAFPRAAALAELGWTDPARKDWADFSARLPAELARDRALGFADDIPQPTDTPVDPAHPARLADQQLPSCTNKVVLNLEAPLNAQRGQRYLVDAMNPCWIYPQADLTHGARLSVSVTRLPFNFQLGADRDRIPLRPPVSPYGELLVTDGCDGKPVATVLLDAALRRPGVSVLHADVAPLAGKHDLCLVFTQRSLDPMWVVGWAEVDPR
jgi:hexosaminidase